MKTLLLILLCLSFSWHATSQQFQLRIIGQTNFETKIIDSLQYNKSHKNIKSITEEINKVSANLNQKGYLDISAEQPTKISDTLYEEKINLGERVKSIHIYTGLDKILNSVVSATKNNILEIPYTELDIFLNETIKKLEQSGYALARLKLTNIQRHKNNLYADIIAETEQKRKLNSIVIQYPENGQSNKFPKGHLKQINKKYQNTIFNQKAVERIHSDFEKFGFVNQIKYPEILFTKDNTSVYVYLEKRNSNSFDGFLGFSNNENKKITLTGYLDIALENILGSGEQISLYWKSDGNDQKTFNGRIELPYLFKTPIGIKAQLNIFRQDSTFQNTKTAIDLSYYLNYNSRFYLGYHSTQSSEIQNSNNTIISDYNNSFITSSFEYTNRDALNTIFPIKSKIQTSLGIGKRTISASTEDSKNHQLTLSILGSHIIYLNKKNSIYLNSQSNYLKSNQYINNELFRFGGFNSIRGFAENSLEAYFSTSLLSEYRYILSPSLYTHTILDYGLFKNTSAKINITENLIGIGAGFGLQTKNGLLKLAVANGHKKKQQFEIYNTIIHISYNVKF